VKFLADMGVSDSTVHLLRDKGHEIAHLRDESLHRLADIGILEKASREGRAILTFDLDFGELLATSRAPFPSVIVFRLHNQTPASVNPRLMNILGECSSEIEKGAIVIVEESRYRVHRLPIA
jgi:predicted nuclease of predicted toxin-antitoxin system